MKCKGIPDKPILEMLAKSRGKWHNWRSGNYLDLSKALPLHTPDKLVLGKIRMVVRRGVVEGCVCGCRGDFEITGKGLEELYLGP